MQNHNAFLKDFLEMRKTSKISGPSTTSGLASEVLPQTKKSARKPKKQIKAELETEKPGINTIIEEKPHKRVVIEYLQTKSNEYTTQKMA
jgi:hypothetical protein